MSGKRWRLAVIALGAGLAVVVAAVAVWGFVLRDTAEPALVADALRRFRQQAEQSGAPISPGVYVYATRGSESVSALGGVRHAYPARSTITATKAQCGVTLRWDVLKTRWNSWTLCGDTGALRLAAWSEEHVFFGQLDRTDWRCEATPWLPGERRPATSLPWRCRSSDTRQDGTIAVVGDESVRGGSVAVEALHVRAVVQERGGARGQLSEERWLEPETGLPLRIVYRVRTVNPSPIGDVTFEEQYELRLVSLAPRR
jgi:hypothetical protein